MLLLENIASCNIIKKTPVKVSFFIEIMYRYFDILLMPS